MPRELDKHMEANIALNYLWKLIPILISSMALILVLYKDFLQGSKLHTSINYVVSMRIPSQNKQSLLQEMLLDDLLSENISKKAQDILNQYTALSSSIETKNRPRLTGELIELTKQDKVSYDPPNELIEKYFDNKLFGTSFYIPLIVYNSGRKYGHVSSLVLIAESEDNPELKWAYTPFVELLPKGVLRRDKEQKDGERFSNIFTGFCIGPGQDVRTDPYFIPMHSSENTIISRTNIIPGTYLMTVAGYGANGKECFRTESVKYKLTVKMFIEAFHGTENAIFFNTENNISSALQN